MSIQNGNSNYFAEAEQEWDLRSLFDDLEAKQLKKVTPAQQRNLKALLLGLSPRDMSPILNIEEKSLRPAFSELYRLIEELNQLPEKTVTYRNVPLVLAKYRKEGRYGNVSPNWTEYNENIWVGRVEQSEALCQKILGDYRIAIILGITGIGKTALAERVAEQTKQTWDQIARINFDDNKVSESFLEAASSMLSQFGISPTTEDYKKTDGLLELLVYNVQSRQVLLIIDSLELILGENTQGEQTLKDATWQIFFKRLLTANRCNGRIILTSQILPGVLEQIASRYTQYFSKSVMSGLNDLEQLELFAKACLDVSENSESCIYLRRIGAIYEGHPLSLRTIIGEIQELCFGNVLAYWEQYSEEFEIVERDIVNVDSYSISEDKWKINRLSLSMENKVQYRLQQTFLRLKNSCYLAYCLLCEASIFRGIRLEKQWTNQFKERGDLSQELSDYEIKEALNKLYAWYLVESELQNNKRYIRLHNLVRSVALEHLNDLP